jgi:hypothetical protein
VVRPTPAQLYKADDRQAAYESGHAQMYDHDPFVFHDRLDAIVDSLRDDDLDREEAELRAAALDAAEDALRTPAAGMWEAAPFDRRLSQERTVTMLRRKEPPSGSDSAGVPVHQDPELGTYIYLCHRCGQPLSGLHELCDSALHPGAHGRGVGRAVRSTELARLAVAARAALGAR